MLASTRAAATPHAPRQQLDAVLDANGTDAGGSPGDASAGDGHGDGERQLRRRLVDVDSALAAALDTLFRRSPHRATTALRSATWRVSYVSAHACYTNSSQQPPRWRPAACAVMGAAASMLSARTRPLPKVGEALDGDDGDRSVRGSGAAAAGGGVASLAVAAASSASLSATEGAGPLPSRWLEPESAEHAARRRLQQSLSDLQREALLLRPHSELTASEIVLLAPDWQRRLLPTAQIGKDGALEMMQSLLRAEYGESLCNATCGPHTHAPYMRARARLLPHSCVSAPHALRAISLLLFSVCAPLVAPLPRKPI